MFAKSEEKTSHRFGIVVLKTEISVSRPIENSGVEWVLSAVYVECLIGKQKPEKPILFKVTESRRVCVASECLIGKQKPECVLVVYFLRSPSRVPYRTEPIPRAPKGRRTSHGHDAR